MGEARIERVALQVVDLEASVKLFSELLGTTFRRKEVALPGGQRLRLAFSPVGIELLEEAPSSGVEKLRSFHIRVDDVAEMRAAVIAAGGEVLSEFQVGDMTHMATRVGPFRIMFVAYPGESGMNALFPHDAHEGES